MTFFNKLVQTFYFAKGEKKKKTNAEKQSDFKVKERQNLKSIRRNQWDSQVKNEKALREKFLKQRVLIACWFSFSPSSQLHVLTHLKTRIRRVPRDHCGHVIKCLCFPFPFHAFLPMGIQTRFKQKHESNKTEGNRQLCPEQPAGPGSPPFFHTGP